MSCNIYLESTQLGKPAFRRRHFGSSVRIRSTSQQFLFADSVQCRRTLNCCTWSGWSWSRGRQLARHAAYLHAPQRFFQPLSVYTVCTELELVLTLTSLLLPTPTMSVGVGKMFESVCLSICLSVCPEHNSRTNDHKVFKLGIGNDLGIHRSGTVFEFKGQRSRPQGQ